MKLNYWNWLAIGIFILSKILLGGCGGFGSDKSTQKSECKNKTKGEFSKWKHYDEFWKEEGNNAYQDYLERINNENIKDA